jgi:hypothetical protein
MAWRPDYRGERAERNRVKAAKREAKRAERRDKRLAAARFHEPLGAAENCEKQGEGRG